MAQPARQIQVRVAKEENQSEVQQEQKSPDESNKATVVDNVDGIRDIRFSSKSRRRLRVFKFYFRHPFFRLFVAYFVTFCNFMIYAEDPVAHSNSGCEVPLIGHDYAFVVDRYPPGGFSALKVFLWLTAVVIGMLIGKFIVHRLLFRRVLKLSMFNGCQGSWMLMFFSTLLSLFVISFIYNAFLKLDEPANTPYLISAYMGMKNATFMKAAALGTWMGDFITAWMVTDMMLQEKRRYPHWAKGLRRWWSTGWNRVVAFWIVLLVLTAIVASVIIIDFVNWDKVARDFVYTNELGRAFLASFILVMDFTIVMQDWDFPMFENNFEIKLPGLNTAHIHIKPPEWIAQNWAVHISGKWFNYGILLIVLLLDLNMWKNQIFYKPYDFGQYTGPDDRIYTVLDTVALANKNTTTLSHQWRWNQIDPITNSSYGLNDVKMNSRYRGYSLGLKGLAFVPSLFTFILFGALIWFFGRDAKYGSSTTMPHLEHMALTRGSASRDSSDVKPVDESVVDGKTESNGIEDKPRSCYAMTATV